MQNNENKKAKYIIIGVVALAIFSVIIFKLGQSTTKPEVTEETKIATEIPSETKAKQETKKNETKTEKDIPEIKKGRKEVNLDFGNRVVYELTDKEKNEIEVIAQEIFQDNFQNIELMELTPTDYDNIIEIEYVMPLNEEDPDAELFKFVTKLYQFASQLKPYRSDYTFLKAIIYQKPINATDNSVYEDYGNIILPVNNLGINIYKFSDEPNNDYLQFLDITEHANLPIDDLIKAIINKTQN